MADTFPAQTLSISIGCSPAKVYAFASNPENLPQWAAGLCKSVKKSGADWVVETPAGAMTLRFAEKNAFGILDHRVLARGREVYVPMRVFANGSGSEVIFTLFRLAGMSDAQYAKDAEMVKRDLTTLKSVLEK